MTRVPTMVSKLMRREKRRKRVLGGKKEREKRSLSCGMIICHKPLDVT